MYEVAEDETRYTALKKTNKSLAEDNAEMQQLLDFLRTRPEAEALAVLHRLRSGADPSSVLELIRDSDLLLQASTRKWGSHDGDVDGGPGSISTRHEHKNKQTAYPVDGERRSRSGSFETDGESNAEKMAAMERKYAALQRDVNRMQEFYRYIHSMPEAEVTRIVQRIRSSKDPLTVMDFLSKNDSVTL